MTSRQIPESLDKLIPVGVTHIDLVAVVCAVIRPYLPGLIEFQGITWRAQCNSCVELFPGMSVQIIDRFSNTLVVEPLPGVT